MLADDVLIAPLRAVAGEALEVRSRADTAVTGAQLVVHVQRGWDLGEALAVQRATRLAGVALLHCGVGPSLGTVGPWVEPGRPGCVLCAETRRRFVAGEPKALSPVARTAVPAPWLHGLFELLVDVVLRYRDEGVPLDGRQVFALDGQDLSGHWHRFQAFASCPECGELPLDSLEAAVVPRRVIPQAAKESFRARAMWLSPAELRAELLDWRYGVVSHVHRVSNAPMALTGTEHHISSSPTDVEQGWGRASSYGAAETVAFLEVLERHASLAPRGKRTAVTGSYAELADRALDPRLLGLPGPSSSLARFSPDLELAWVWGYSLRDRRPVLVPEQSAYYRFSALEPSARLTHETSNGAALGASLEEAAFHGMLELVERDGFLLAWYGQLGVPELTLASTHPGEIDLLVDKAAARGYRVHLFDIRTELGVPAVWALALTDDEEAPRSFSAAAAHPDPEQAVLGALREVVPNIYLHARKPHHTDAALRAMLDDPTRVETIDDHVALYTITEAQARLAFLLRPERARLPLAEAFPGWRERWLRTDLSECLELLVGDVAGAGMDTIVVDTTSAELRRFGLASAKVIIPGTLPMAFGHDAQRLHGLRRLLEVPVQLGYWSAPRRLDELPLHPHPFP